MLYPLYMMSLVTYFAKYFFVIGFDFKNFHNFCNHVCKGVSFIASYFLSKDFKVSFSTKLVLFIFVSHMNVEILKPNDSTFRFLVPVR